MASVSPQMCPGPQVTGLRDLCSPPDMLRPLVPCQAPTWLPVHRDLWRSPGSLNVSFRNASVPSRAPGSLCSFPRHLRRTPSALGSQLLGSRASASPQACAIAQDLSSSGLGTSTPPAAPGRPCSSQEVHANKDTGLTCSGARGSGQSRCCRRTPPSSAARPSDGAARGPGDRSLGSGRSLLRAREGLG